MARPDPKRELETLEEVCSALAHAARRHMLLVVWFRGGAMSAGDIAARFSHSWPTTSRHLRVLEQAGLLEQEKDGRTRLYRVRTDKLDVLRRWLAWFDPAQENAESSGAASRAHNIEAVPQRRARVWSKTGKGRIG